MSYSRVKRFKQEKRTYTIRKMSTVGAASVLVGIGMVTTSPVASADSVDVTSQIERADVTASLDEQAATSEATRPATELTSTDAEVDVDTESASTSEVAPQEGLVSEAPANEESASLASAPASDLTPSKPRVDQSQSPAEQTAPSQTPAEQPAPSQTPATHQTEPASEQDLSEFAQQLVKDADLDVASLTPAQREALNRLYQSSGQKSGYQMTYKQFESIADTLIKQDPKYAIPYFNAQVIENMAAATTKDAQTGQVTDLDVWDSWPVQDLATGYVSNWNGFQLVVAMMGAPKTNDNHLYLLYNAYGDNDLQHWKNAGSIFGYGLDAVSQQWSGSAVVNSDGTIQLYYTDVDTSDANSNNQRLATATLNLAVENGQVVIKSVDNKQVLTPKGGDGYYYQSYAQWRKTFTGADNIAMRDPHVVLGEDGNRYLVFEASTGLQNYQSENQIYDVANYGGDAKYTLSSLFRILENRDMFERAQVANAALGIVRLTGDEKTPSVAQYMTPLVSAPMVSDEIERPNVVKIGEKYYLFAASRLNHGSNDDAWELANDVVGDNVVMLGWVSDSLTGGYQPLNDTGVVLTASVPSDWRTATYSYYAVPVEGYPNRLLITAYMTNRNGVAGDQFKSTWAPSFLIEVLPDGTTQVLSGTTEQGDWIWDESSRSPRTLGSLMTSHLEGEDDGYIEWNLIGGYGLKDHQAQNLPTSVHRTDVPLELTKPSTELNDTPSTGTHQTPGIPSVALSSEPSTRTSQAQPSVALSDDAQELPETGESSSAASLVLAGILASSLAYAGLGRKKED